jgi:hypothetical protein
MLTPSPFSTREGSLEEFRKLGLGPIPALADAAEFACAMLLVHRTPTYDDVVAGINRLREVDNHLDRDFLIAGLTADAVVTQMTTCGLISGGHDEKFHVLDEASHGWLGGRGIVRFIHLLRPDVPASVAWGDALAGIAWRHEHREARTSMARQLVKARRFEELGDLCDWLAAHIALGLDDVSRTIQFCLWQFSVELMNCNEVLPPNGFRQLTAAISRFSAIRHNQIFLLFDAPCFWSNLLNDDNAAYWGEHLLKLTSHNDRVVQKMAWSTLRSHGRLAARHREQLCKLVTSDADLSDVAAEVLAHQCEIPGEEYSLQQLVRGAGSQLPDVARRCVGVLLSRIDQPSVQRVVHSDCYPCGNDRVVLRMAYQMLRAATLNAETLAGLEEEILTRTSRRDEHAVAVLLAQHGLRPEFLGKLKANIGKLRMILPTFRHQAQLLLRFVDTASFPLPYKVHQKTYRPDSIVPSAQDRHSGQYLQGIDLEHVLRISKASTPQEVTDAFVLARVVSEQNYVPVERFVALLEQSDWLQRIVLYRAMAKSVSNSLVSMYPMMACDRAFVASSLASAGTHTVIVCEKDKLRTRLQRIVRDEHIKLNDDSKALTAAGSTDVFQYIRRDCLTLDNGLRGEALAPAAVADEDDAAAVGGDADQPLRPAATNAKLTSAEVGATGLTPELYRLLHEVATDIKTLSQGVQRTSGTTHSGHSLSEAPQLDEGSKLALFKYDDITAHIDPAQRRHLDEDSFKRHLQWLYLHHFSGQPSRDAFAFFYYIAWSYEHMELSPEYDAIAGTVEADVVELLPDTLRGKNLVKPYKSRGSLGRAILRTLKKASFVPVASFLYGGIFR